MSRANSVPMLATYMLMAACIMSSLLPTAVYMSVALLSMALIALRGRKMNFPRPWVVWSFIYLFSIAINSFYSVNSIATWTFLRNTFTHIIIALLFISAISIYSDFQKILNAFVFIGVISSLYVIFLERSSLLLLPLGTETFGGGNIPFTYILIPATMSCIFLVMETKKLYYYIILAFLFTISLLTTSRKAIFLPMVFFMIYSYLHSKKAFFRTFKYILIGGGLVALLFMLFIRYDGLSNLSMGRLTSLISFISEGEGDESLANRENLIQNGLSYISERPIFGYGMNTYSYMTGSDVYSHNNYIETIFGGGIVMLLIYYSIYLMNIIRLWHRTDNYSYFLLAVCIVYIISDYGTVSYFIYPQLFLLIMATSVSKMPLNHLTNKK